LKQANSSLETGKVQCPVCKSNEIGTYFQNCTDLLYQHPGKWRLCECKKCNIVFTDPVLSEEELLSYYPENYSAYNKKRSDNYPVLIKLLRKAVRFPYTIRFGDLLSLEPPFGKGRLLDIGCGSGLIMKQAIEQGWKCWGIDVSPFAVAKAKKNVPEATISQDTLEGFATETRFDLIYFSHVLEHLHNPKENISKCFNLLAPGGKLVVTVPNITSFEAKIFGKRWIGFDVPRHLIHFREDVIMQLLQESGFCKLKLRPAFFASSISESLILLLPEILRYKVLYSQAARYFYGLIIFPASVTYLMGNKSIIEITVQKPYVH